MDRHPGRLLMPRDGYQGWSRAKETAWTRVFAPKTVMAVLHAKKCYPPCDDCKCVKP
jgi:hypothetical protein